MQRRNVVDIRRQARNPQKVGGGSAPPSFVGIVDALAAAGDTVNFAVSVGYQLTTASTGSYIRVRRASDNAEADIGLNPATRMIHTGDLINHCGASDGLVVTVYDRSGNTRDFTNATPGEQPKIYDGATGIILTGNLPMCLLDGGAGTAGTGDGWARGDAAGYSGTQAIEIWAFFSMTDVTTTIRTVVQLGAGSATTSALRHLLAPAGIGYSNQDGSSSGNYRLFTPVTPLSTLSDYRLAMASGALVGAATLSQRGVALSESAVASAAGPSIATTGSSIGSNTSQARGMTGGLVAVIGLNALASPAGSTALNDFGATLRGVAGV